jgi:hypothetical protein
MRIPTQAMSPDAIVDQELQALIALSEFAKRIRTARPQTRKNARQSA